jgi:hypothetical protein
MNLIGLMPVRNEDWILGLSARVALMWCDSLVILDHASTDWTVEIIWGLMREYRGRVVVLSEPDPTWAEMAHRQAMIEMARSHGSTHIAICDCDEILTGNLLGSIRGHIEAAGPNMLMLPGYNLRGGLSRYHANGVWANRWFSTAFKDNPRLSWSGDKFHSREPGGITWSHVQPVKQGDGGMMHLWGASDRRLIAKHALYKVTERLRWPDKPVAEIDRMYSWAIKGDSTNGYGTPETWTYADVPAEWWAPYMGDSTNGYGTPETWTYADVPAEWWAPYIARVEGLSLTMPIGSVDIEAEPWQEAEVRRLVAEHGRERFEGLDLFGGA